ncbi:hypothetical protein IMCC14465_15660 [alpha proteobacterium IMCC14465]|uniref:Carnitine dehydratase n=1 Tax=alpha proteobacterium IMCC14465 TaxID=1220535 RepID=J9DYE3_9PROT|nr:hypothetical protein IMCC14465_15660 [alpha proteobacterium IMCC14465]
MGQGPLNGLRIIEFVGIGPGPFASMLLTDMGAEVLSIYRKGTEKNALSDIASRGRKSITLDVKTPAGQAAVMRLVAAADGLIEGFRPGVMERLGLGPDDCLAINKKLVYGRMTGWGQTGPLSHAAGHDINYIALTGALAAIGSSNRPIPPLNLVGDFGGGAMFLAMGMCAAFFEAERSGEGQVIDCAMTDGSASLMTFFFNFMAQGLYKPQRESNMLDGGAHYYNTYETLDGKFISIGSIEPQFYAELRDRLGLTDKDFDHQHESEKWPDLKNKLAAVFKTKTRDEWDESLSGTDVCYAPVLTLDEAISHPHNKDRETLIERDGVVQPNVAPRFSRTPGAIQGAPVTPGQHNDTALQGWGFTDDEVEALKSDKIV